MKKVIYLFFLLFVLSAIVIPQTSKNVDTAIRFRIVQDLNTDVEKSAEIYSSSPSFDLVALALINKSASQLEELGSRYGFVKSDAQLQELGSRYGFVKSDAQLQELGSRYGFVK